MAIAPVHSDPSRASELQYPPGISVSNTDTLFFMSGATAIPLYHMHPHIDEECIVPDDIREQTRRILVTFDEILKFNGLAWHNVVKFTQFLTDIREHDAVQEVITEFFAGSNWKPASSSVAINSLSAPGARLEIDVIAAKSDD
ncbi:RidA family protein [Parafrigoribacterium humi]|jgi:2-iminobutanoate/2-iminopropanoate deaminase/2-aminomuconate deaminase|uniref:RidA family protein n=1 Tax=Parafrigoribacterium humi TaxID=3144664 RepID=UPI0032EB349F